MGIIVETIVGIIYFVGVIIGLIGLVPIVLGLLMLLLFLVYMVISILLSSVPFLTLFSGHFAFMSEHVWYRGLDLVANRKAWKLVGCGVVLMLAATLAVALSLHPVILGLLLVVAGRIMFSKIHRYR